MSKSSRGFASMDKAIQREIASMGGVAGHNPGKGKKRSHEWTKEEAREAGRKGGLAVHKSRGRVNAE